MIVKNRILCLTSLNRRASGLFLVFDASLISRVITSPTRVLFVPTGALLSQVSFNEGRSVPGIAHGVILEAVKKNDKERMIKKE